MNNAILAATVALIAITFGISPANAGIVNLKTLNLKSTPSDDLLHKTQGRRRDGRGRRHGQSRPHVQHHPRRPKRRYGGAIAAGILLGTIGAIAATRSNRAYYSDRYYGRPTARGRYYRGPKFASRCRRWHYRCLDGSDRACSKFDKRC